MGVAQRLNYRDQQEGTPGTVHICGNFTTAGAADPSVFSSGPFTVTHLGTGQYTVTFKEAFTEYLEGHAGLMDATASAKRCFVMSNPAPTLGSYASNTGATITIETQSISGTKADLTGPIVAFSVYFRKGTLKK